MEKAFFDMRKGTNACKMAVLHNKPPSTSRFNLNSPIQVSRPIFFPETV